MCLTMINAKGNDNLYKGDITSGQPLYGHTEGALVLILLKCFKLYRSFIKESVKV